MSEQTTIAVETRPAPSRPAPKKLPPWKVLLHNDRVNYVEHVVKTLVEIVRLPQVEATRRTWEAHREGAAVVATTHREHAELLVEQLRSKRLTATAEPDGE